MASAVIPVDIVLAVVELLRTFSGIVWAVVQPTRETKIENLMNKVGLLRIEGIILIKFSIALKEPFSSLFLAPH